jgi:hypothetical protein
MLSQVVVETATPRTFNIEAVSADEILIIKKISGLTSPGNTLYSGRTAQGRGYYQGRLPSDHVVIKTSIGDRSIKRNGVDIMASMASDSTWPILQGGSEDKLLRTYGTTVNDGDTALTYYVYRAAWWGL